MAPSVTLLVGTTKGVFLISSDAERDAWTLRGPLCDGWPINHVIGEPETGTLWAAGGSAWEGAGVWTSEDGGESWRLTQLADGQRAAWVAENPEVAATLGVKPADPGPFSGQIDALWSLGRAGGRLYAGAKPAALYVSEDRGGSWEKVESLTDHPSAASWQPGGAGLVLHSIVASPEDPRKLWVGISAAGVFATEDGGASWEPRDRRANIDGGAGAAEPQGEDPFFDPQKLGGCVHNFVRAEAAPGGDLLYQQNHHGVFRSPDGGRSWHEVTQGLPTNFGFPIAVHPRDPQTIWVLPLNGDSVGRFPPDASAAVWRSRDGGESWQAQRAGLPGRDCFFTVLRQNMATDRQEPAGVYFGTNSGSIFASSDEGASWREIARHLPTVLCVETLETA